MDFIGKTPVIQNGYILKLNIPHGCEVYYSKNKEFYYSKVGATDIFWLSRYVYWEKALMNNYCKTVTDYWKVKFSLKSKKER